MADQPVSSTQTFLWAEQPTLKQLLRGWQWQRVCQPDGSEVFVQVFLTPEDFLNPQEGDELL